MIENGPTKEDFDRLFNSDEKIYFKIEGEYYPHRIIDAIYLDDGSVNLLGKTLTGLFTATYDFKIQQGYLITKYGRIVDDV